MKYFILILLSSSLSQAFDNPIKTRCENNPAYNIGINCPQLYPEIYLSKTFVTPENTITAISVNSQVNGGDQIEFSVGKKEKNEVVSDYVLSVDAKGEVQSLVDDKNKDCFSFKIEKSKDKEHTYCYAERVPHDDAKQDMQCVQRMLSDMIASRKGKTKDCGPFISSLKSCFANGSEKCQNSVYNYAKSLEKNVAGDTIKNSNTNK